MFLGDEFDNNESFWFTKANNVFCFGMSEFFIDEEAPPHSVPEPSSFTLLGLGLFAVAFIRRNYIKLDRLAALRVFSLHL